MERLIRKSSFVVRLLSCDESLTWTSEYVFQPFGEETNLTGNPTEYRVNFVLVDKNGVRDVKPREPCLGQALTKALERLSEQCGYEVLTRDGTFTLRTTRQAALTFQSPLSSLELRCALELKASRGSGASLFETSHLSLVASSLLAAATERFMVELGQENPQSIGRAWPERMHQDSAYSSLLASSLHSALSSGSENEAGTDLATLESACTVVQAFGIRA